MSQPFNSVEDVRRFVAELDGQRCPVALRTRELREEREQQARKKREAERQREEQQGAAARNSETWYAWLDQRIAEHFRQRFDRDADGNVGPMTAAIGEALGHTRAEIRKEFEAAIEKLREEFRVGIGRLPIAKTWNPDEVCYRGDVVVAPNGVFQALKDTGKPPAADHPDWILLARAGRDGRAAPMLNFCGSYLVGEKYQRFDVVRYDVGAFVAVRDNPGIPGDGDGWALLTLHGGRGPEGETGPRGRKGERGPRGETLTVVAWTLDIAHYRAVPTLSNGTQGAVLDLYPLFERFNAEAVLPAIDQVTTDAERRKLLSPLG
jgi:hypothetical protein